MVYQLTSPGIQESVRGGYPRRHTPAKATTLVPNFGAAGELGLAEEALRPGLWHRIAASFTNFKEAFKGFGDYALFEEAIKPMPLGERLKAAFVRMKEGQKGTMLIHIIQDTAILAVPKGLLSLVTSHSASDQLEIWGGEFLESFLFYCLSPVLAGALLVKGFHKLIPKEHRPDIGLLKMSIDDIKKRHPGVAGEFSEELLRIVPAKLGLAISSLAIATALAFSLNFVKNLITEKVFGITEYKHILNIKSKRDTPKTDTETQQEAQQRLAVINKAYRWLKISALAAASIIAGSMLLTRFSYRNPELQKKLVPLAKWLDFHFAGGKFDINANQLKVLMPFAILGYPMAGRGPVETIEVGCRAIITGSYIAYFSPGLRQWMINHFYKKHKDTFPVMDILTHDGKHYDLKSIPELQKYCAELALKANPTATPEILKAEHWLCSDLGF